ncbi:MAG: tRNA pseudouridine synthase B [Bacteriovoracia bacterium]
MKASKKQALFPPLVFNVFKPARMSSYDVVRHFKRHLPPGFGKIGHFGTLDPFASGVLMIGICGSARLNDFIHEYLPKTYLAVGKLGIETPTGDYTSEVIQKDDSLYLQREISSFSPAFIEDKLREKFLGDYWQAPHKYSASKFMGKNLHEWAREGIEVKKEPVKRFVHKIEVVKYHFPYLSVRVEVSSGTYVRTLFSDMCNYLGTLGSLISLVRESVGPVTYKDALKMKDWPQEKSLEIIEKGMGIKDVLPFSTYRLDEKQTLAFKNGAFLRPDNLEVLTIGEISDKYFWMVNSEGKLLGLSEKSFSTEIRPKINFHSEDQASLSSHHDPE